ncbi:ABC transporter ATP-binding protein [Hippea sp. KM1]|uniref:ABC transporter ATP-binding protein n=1 Tax=Hippea sp. KM1 TaxID=944481 RepID=UPI00046D60B4|nr:ABC transporter ATP-binding protein [Hippea sp. KM1]
MLELVNVSNFILNGINLTVKRGELFVLMGANGAGKTTLLNAIAGIVPYSGRILLDGCDITKHPPEMRNIGYVFQDLLLFPHMSCYENIVFGAKLKGVFDRQRLDEIIEVLKIGHLLKKKPGQLSGGEAQRIALARVLLIRPRLLLMDEPFSKLDRKTAEDMRLELKRLQKEIGITTVFVSHNRSEAALLADRIGFLDRGVLKWVKDSDRIELSGNIQRQGGDVFLNIWGLNLRLDGYNNSGSVRVVVDVSKLILSPKSNRNCFECTIRRLEFVDGGAMVLLDFKKGDKSIELNLRNVNLNSIASGRAFLCFPEDSLNVIFLN